MTFDPLVPDTGHDVHALYRDLRASCPVVHSGRYRGFWALFRYGDVVRVLTESQRFITSVQNVVPKVAFTGRRPPLHLDPPEHTIYRRVLNPLLRAGRIDALEGRVRAHAVEHLRPLIARGHCDLGTEFAGGFPILAFAEFLNVDRRVIDQVRDIGGIYVESLRDFNDDAVRAASLDLYEVARELIADRMANPLDPADDPTSALLVARHEGQPLPPDMVLGMIRQVLVVGIIAPTVVIGSMVVHLATDRALQDELRATPALIPDAVEELLRLYSPYRGFARTATEPVTLSGTTIPAGEPIAMVFTSANRDETVFDCPDEFRLGRAERHIAFGLGPHQCPGIPFARMELRVALEELLDRTSGFELAGPVDMTRWPEYGATSVPVRISARAANTFTDACDSEDCAR
jgi:cytochrome P450